MASIDFSLQVNQLANQLDYIAYKLTHDTEDAKDLIQETIFKALLNRERFIKGTNLKGWLYTIMKNIFINNYRRQSKHRAITEESKTMGMADMQLRATMNYGEMQMSLSEIGQAFNDIDEAIRMPFLMHFEGLKYEEIALHMKIPLGTVKSRIFFARKELQIRVKRH